MRVLQLEMITCLKLNVGDYKIVTVLMLPLAGYVGDSVTVTDRCVIGACCTVDTANETLPPGTVITGGDQLKWCREPTTQVKEQYRYLSCYCDFVI